MEYSVMGCPICEERGYWTIPFARDAQAEQLEAASGRDAPYEWRLCRRCGNAYPSRPPDRLILQKLWDVNRADSGASAEGQAARWAYRRSIAKAGAARSYRLFAPLPQTKRRFLDIACGLGETVHMFEGKGWDAEGIDADPATAPIHRELGIRSRIAQFENTEIGAGYDLIHIAHAIYFITDPMQFMRAVRERLAPGGIFCVVIADFLANADPGLPSYAHTFYPTAASMRYALAKAGFATLLSKRLSGSVFIAARPATIETMPSVSPGLIRLGYRTKAVRFATLGRPYLALRQFAKRLLRRS